MSDNDSDVFQHFPLSARPIRQAVIEARAEALTPFKQLPARLHHVGAGWEFHSMTPSLDGLDLYFEGPFPGVGETLRWTPYVEGERGEGYPFDREHWPSEIEVAYDEVWTFNRHLKTIWNIVESAFLDAALEGREAIYARIGSPVERSVTRIPPDVWANFCVVDWKTGRAVVSGTNHVIYGACSVSVSRTTDARSSTPEQALALLTRENEDRVVGGLSPLNIAETEEWAKREGYTREDARALRKQLPDSLKLARGQKAADLKG